MVDYSTECISVEMDGFDRGTIFAFSINASRGSFDEPSRELYD